MSSKPGQVTYPVGHQLDIGFCPFADRLLLKARRMRRSDARLQITRRMTLLVLQQLLQQLSTMSGLDKTPIQYWQDVLRMAHEQAMAEKSRVDEQRAQSTVVNVPTDTVSGDRITITGHGGEDQVRPVSPGVDEYLATDLAVKLSSDELLLAFRGVPVASPVSRAAEPVPVLAISLKSEHVHQLIRLLISTAAKAQWHLPVDLPWLDDPQPSKSVERPLSSTH